MQADSDTGQHTQQYLSHTNTQTHTQNHAGKHRGSGWHAARCATAWVCTDTPAAKQTSTLRQTKNGPCCRGPRERTSHTDSRRRRGPARHTTRCAAATWACTDTPAAKQTHTFTPTHTHTHTHISTPCCRAPRGRTSRTGSRRRRGPARHTTRCAAATWVCTPDRHE
jgi:hypothetical protein